MGLWASDGGAVDFIVHKDAQEGGPQTLRPIN